MKNRNRQDAAKKRVRDNNGKFTGGLLLWKPQIIFTTEKFERTFQNSNKAHEDAGHHPKVEMSNTTNEQ